MTCKAKILYVGNHNVVELQALTNGVTDVIDTGATVTCTLKDSAGTNVTGDTWPKTMPHDAGTPGTYRATLSDSIVITNKDNYTVHIDATGTGSEIGHWEIPLKAETRDY